ncbi:uncharacterized protein [Diabrotica undecimpunctata]|uniref:uncharacterized protein isoform X1 n=1 Tax=Diabrotica undecimpunctata TaxID=50387 RepID=UPI003B63FF7E
MKYLVSYLLIGLMFCVSLNKSQLPYPPGINATVYYETGCPYDKSFIEQQLNPILEGNLSNFVNLQLLSFDSKSHKSADSARWVCYDDRIETCPNNIDTTKDPASLELGVTLRCLQFLMCYLRKLKRHFEYAPIDSVEKFCTASHLGLYYIPFLNCSAEQVELHFQKPNNSFEDQSLDKINLTSNLKPEEINVAITTIQWESKSQCMDRIKKVKESEKYPSKAEKLEGNDSSAGTHTVININTLLLGFFVYLNIQFYYTKVE